MENEDYFYIFLVIVICCISVFVIVDNKCMQSYDNGYADGYHAGYWEFEEELNSLDYRIVLDSEFIDVGDYVTTTKQFENMTGKHVDGIVIAIWNDEVAWIVNENEGHEEINIMWLREI